MKALKRLGARDRRALMWGVVVLVPALLGTSVVRPYIRARAVLHDRIAEQRDLLSRELGVLRSAGQHTDDLQIARNVLEQQRVYLFQARDPLAATAALVAAVGERARRFGVQIESIESRPPERLASGLVGVRIEVSGRGDFEGLLRWLKTAESESRLVRVDWLTVSRAGGSDVVDASDVEQLGIAAAIRAYVRETP
jgi:type II secretory pathway component PulM